MEGGASQAWIHRRHAARVLGEEELKQVSMAAASRLHRQDMRHRPAAAPASGERALHRDKVPPPHRLAQLLYYPASGGRAAARPLAWMLQAPLARPARPAPPRAPPPPCRCRGWQPMAHLLSGEVFHLLHQHE